MIFLYLKCSKSHLKKTKLMPWVTSVNSVHCNELIGLLGSWVTIMSFRFSSVSLTETESEPVSISFQNQKPNRTNSLKKPNQINFFGLFFSIGSVLSVYISPLIIEAFILFIKLLSLLYFVIRHIFLQKT